MISVFLFPYISFNLAVSVVLSQSALIPGSEMEPAPFSEMMHCTSMLKQMLGSHLGLLQGGLCILPVDHTEGDALWF